VDTGFRVQEEQVGANILEKLFCTGRGSIWWKALAAGGLGKLTFAAAR